MLEKDSVGADARNFDECKVCLGEYQAAGMGLHLYENSAALLVQCLPLISDFVKSSSNDTEAR